MGKGGKMKVLLKNQKIVELDVDEVQAENIRQELNGHKDYVEEYKTTEGKIINDLDIVGVESEEK